MDSWQEEKDKLDRKKAVIFAESEYDFEDTWLQMPKRLHNQLGHPTESAFILDDPETKDFYRDVLYDEDTAIQPQHRAVWRVLAALMEDDVTMLTPQEYRTLPDKHKQRDDTFPGQARWWARKTPDIDTEIISFQGEEELDFKLKNLVESGFLDEGEITALIMGHSSPQGVFGGLSPKDFGDILRDNTIEDKFDQVLLGSCNMGSNPVACVNLSSAFDGTPVRGQGPFEGNFRTGPYSWGTGAIDPDSLRDPSASLESRFFVENAPYQSYTYSPFWKSFDVSTWEKDTGLEENWGADDYAP